MGGCSRCFAAVCAIGRRVAENAQRVNSRNFRNSSEHGFFLQKFVRSRFGPTATPALSTPDATIAGRTRVNRSGVEIRLDFRAKSSMYTAPKGDQSHEANDNRPERRTGRPRDGRPDDRRHHPAQEGGVRGPNAGGVRNGKGGGRWALGFSG